MPSAIVRTQMSGSLAVQGWLCPCMARGRGSEQAQECGECGGLSGRCGVQDSAVRDRNWSCAAGTHCGWPRLAAAQPQ